MPFLDVTAADIELLQTLLEHEAGIADDPAVRTKHFARVPALLDRLEALTKPRRHFTADFTLETPDFDGTRAASGIMKCLGSINGNVITGRWSGTIFDRAGQAVGKYETSWRD